MAARRRFVRSGFVAAALGVVLPVALLVTSVPAQALAPPPPVAFMTADGAVSVHVATRQAAASAAPRVAAFCTGGPIACGVATAATLLVIGGGVACYAIDSCNAKVRATWDQYFGDSDSAVDPSGYTVQTWMVKPLDGATNTTATIRQALKPGLSGSYGETQWANAWCNGVKQTSGAGVVSGVADSYVSPDHFTYPYQGAHPEYNDWTVSCPAGQAMTGVKFQRWTHNAQGVATYKDHLGWGSTDSGAGTKIITGTTLCQRPDGTTYEQTSTDSVTITSTLATVPVCRAGDRALTSRGVDAGGKVAWDVDYRTNAADDAAHPLCAGAACGYSVVVDGEQCAQGVLNCARWTQVNKTTPSRVKCYYGPYVVDTSLCYWLERAFEDEPREMTKPNTDGDPDTHTSPTPNPSPTATSSSSPTVAPRPTPTTTVQPAPAGHCASPYALGAVLPQTAALVNNLGPRFNIQTVYGYREQDAYPDHPSGLAADFMVGTDSFRGQQLAVYAQQNAPSLGVDYVMWDHKIWSQARADEGWRVVADRGSATANHEDHVHVTMLPVSGGAPCSAAGDPERSGECFPSGFGAMNPVNWVLQPLKCAFIPSRDLTPRVTQIQTAFHDSGPMPVIDAVGDIIGGFTQASGCAGPTIPFSVNSGGTTITKTIQPLNACADPMKTVAGYSYALSYVTICIFGALAIGRAVAMGFGFSFSFGSKGGDAA